MRNLFKRKNKSELIRESVKRNFDTVSWKWETDINGNPMPHHHIFPFDNGLSVLVLKNSPETWDGMAYFIIDDITPEGKFRRASINHYTYAGGVGEEEILSICEIIKHLK